MTFSDLNDTMWGDQFSAGSPYIHLCGLTNGDQIGNSKPCGWGRVMFLGVQRVTHLWKMHVFRVSAHATQVDMHHYPQIFVTPTYIHTVYDTDQPQSARWSNWVSRKFILITHIPGPKGWRLGKKILKHACCHALCSSYRSSVELDQLWLGVFPAATSGWHCEPDGGLLTERLLP